MPSLSRRRRQEDQSESEEERRQSTQRRQRRPAPSDDEEEEEADENENGDEEMDVDGDRDGEDQLVKKLVRYALTCEYQRIPIRRTGISEKVIGKQRGAFKRVFKGAQEQLKKKFGMEMVELPAREKYTVKEKRAAQKTKGNSKGTASYILTSILPTEYRTPEIMPPSIVTSQEDEATYIGLYSMIATVIELSPGGAVPDHKLMSYLRRMNIEDTTTLGKTSEILKKMIAQGYLQKTVERNADEETTDWRVGPRGKVEIGSKGIQGLIREVYGDTAPEDLDKRIFRSLGIEAASANRREGEEEQAEGEGEDESMADGHGNNNSDPRPSTQRLPVGRRRQRNEDDY